jgi:hypothetical protein
MQVSPGEREEWAQAMRREVDEIPSEQEALRWALGCLQAGCHERLKSTRLTSWWPVRWAMALWIALAAAETFVYSVTTLSYKLRLFTEHMPYAPNVHLLEVTPFWEPMLTLVVGGVLLLAIVLILRRSRVAFVAVVAPVCILLLRFVVTSSRPESGQLQSLAIVYHRSPFALIWPIAGLAITILICLALWHDWRTPAPRLRDLTLRL